MNTRSARLRSNDVPSLTLVSFRLDYAGRLAELGSGAYRVVYGLDRGTVLKEERVKTWDRNGVPTSNTSEIDFWNEIGGTPLARHYAQLFTWSKDNYLVTMERVAHVYADVEGAIENKAYHVAEIMDSEKYYLGLAKVRASRHPNVDDADEFRLKQQNINRLGRKYQRLRIKLATLRNRMAVWLDQVGRETLAAGYIVHDLHEENIGIRKDGSFVIIDYGAARKSVRYGTFDSRSR